MPLSPKPVRTDLTDREVSRLLGGLIGSLLLMSDYYTVQTALRWWADLPEEVWGEIRAQIAGKEPDIG